MDHVHVVHEGSLAVLTLSRGKANGLNTAMCVEMRDAVRAASADPAMHGLVLASDRPKFFCAGFDIAEVFRYDRAGLTECFRAFGEMFEEILFLEKPVVAALSGHAYAGGAVLALTADVRVIADGPFGFAVNEINIGAVLPPNVYRLMEDAVGVRQARRMLLTGDAIKVPEALAIGLVDDVVPVERVLPRAIELAVGLAEKPAATFAEMKRMTRTVRGYARSADPGPSVDPWFTPETIARKTAMLAALEKPKA
ncbi:MAG: enoyl-CoA hydratase/isomerase family protein [Bryobacteraceae bacterium]